MCSVSRLPPPTCAWHSQESLVEDLAYPREKIHAMKDASAEWCLAQLHKLESAPPEARGHARGGWGTFTRLCKLRVPPVQALIFIYFSGHGRLLQEEGGTRNGRNFYLCTAGRWLVRGGSGGSWRLVGGEWVCFWRTTAPDATGTLHVPGLT